MKSRRVWPLLLTASILALAVAQQPLLYGQTPGPVPRSAEALKELDGRFTFLIASDLGRNGYYDQRSVAEMMGEVAGLADPEFIAVVGDVHHFLGVRSVQDPLWETNFEWIYKHPELMIPWHPVMGNHEYQGSTRAVIDYGMLSRRWEMPARYYAMTLPATETAELLLLFIDTTPLIDKYREDPVKYPDAGKQSMKRQLRWIDSTLGRSRAKWKIVLGHHPVYSGTTKEERERRDLQERLQPLLDQHRVDLSIAGHIHNFQHLQVPGSGVDYFVNSSASQSREVVEIAGAVFGSPEAGFSLCTVTETELTITFVNQDGKILYQYERKK